MEVTCLVTSNYMVMTGVISATFYYNLAVTYLQLFVHGWLLLNAKVVVSSVTVLAGDLVQLKYILF